MLEETNSASLKRGSLNEAGGPLCTISMKEATDRRNSFTDIVAKVVSETRRLSHHILEPLMLTEKASRRASVVSIGDFIHKLVAAQTGEIDKEQKSLAHLPSEEEKILKIIDSYTKSSETPLLDIEIDAEITKQCQEIAKYSARRYLILFKDKDSEQPNKETDLYIDTIFFFLKGIFTHLLEEKISPKCMSLMVSAYLKCLGEISQLVLPHLRKLENNTALNVQNKEHIIASSTLEFKSLIDKSFHEAKTSSRFWTKVGFSGSVISAGIASYILFNINENIECMDIWEDNSDPCNPCIPTRESLLERQQKLIWAMASTVLFAALALFGKNNLRKSDNQEAARMGLKSALGIFERDLCTALRSTETGKSHDLSANPEKICTGLTLPRLSEKLEQEESEAITMKLGETQDISPLSQLSDIELCSQFTNSTLRDREGQQAIL